MLAYSRLYNILKEKILNKEYTTGDKFPTEKDICEQYDVSRITCRHALRLLQEEGFIKRSPGKGTFVRPVQTKKVPILDYDYTRSIQHEAPEITRKLLTKRTITPPENISEMLGSFRSEDCLFLERMDYLHDEPVAFDRAYIPLNLSRNLTEAMLTRVDFLEVWLDAEGLTLLHFREMIEAIEADQEIHELLRVKSGAAMLLATDIMFEANGNSIAVFETIYRGDRFRLVSTKITGAKNEDISYK